MSVSADSIQTLLRQRRDLRSCLQELRKEIAELNQRADGIVSKSSSDIANDPPVTVEAALKTEEPSPQKTVASNTNGKGATPAPSAPLRSSADLAAKESVTAPKQKASTVQSQPSEQQEDIGGIEGDTLQYRAVLLALYFLNHPSPVDNAQLINLDTAIQKVEDLGPGQAAEKALDNLRDAYRSVASLSYQKLGINGATLADSRGSITLLWSVPLCIAGLTLVIFPLLLLTRSLSERMFIADFSSDVSIVVTCIAAFLWGIVGALSDLAWGIARQAKRHIYRKENIRGVGLRAVLGGILGITVFLALVGWMPAQGIVPDMVIGILSFFVGLASSIIFSFLHRMIGKLTGNTKVHS